MSALPPVALTIAGVDSSGGAGVAADLATFGALGVWGTCAVTAVTAQNSLGVKVAEAISPDVVAAQVRAVMADLPVAAIKTGMLVSGPHISAVLGALDGVDAPLVVDPVMRATTGAPLFEGALGAYDDLLARATVVTPNVAEAGVLGGLDVVDRATMMDAARVLLDRGLGAVLITGGHLGGSDAVDCLLMRGHTEAVWLIGPRSPTENTHGTGCVLSAAIAARLAHGDDIETACRAAKLFVTASLGRSHAFGAGPGPVDPLHR